MTNSAAKQRLIQPLIERLIAPSRPFEGPNADMAFNPALAEALALDPAATALLPGVRLPMAVDSARPELFRISSRGTLLFSPALLPRPKLLGVVVRWAQEAAFLLTEAGGSLSRQNAALAAATRHGAALIARLPIFARKELKRWIPAELWRDEALDEGPLTAAWLARTLGREFYAETPAEGEAGELALPVETLLEAGGDARIISSPESGMNRYGATSRPRPEAVHFSSSTASSVSDYAFGALDALRHALLVDVLFGGLSLAHANERLAEAVRREILGVLTLSADEADVILAPSGTDTELLALIVALAAGPRLANILIAPEETGRAVKTAAAGLYFQEGAAFAKGKRIWAAADIEVSSVAARDEAGRPFPLAAVDRAVGSLLEIAISQRRRALLHVLIGSKTGISAPSPKFVAVSGAPSRDVDVVADACQWRTAGETLGEWVRAGWMAQISGSKFFTGPPLCGALVVPAGCASGARPRLACGPRRQNSAGELLESALARRLRRTPRRGRELRAAAALGGGADRGDAVSRGLARSRADRVRRLLRRSARAFFRLPAFDRTRAAALRRRPRQPPRLRVFRRKFDHLFRRPRR